MGKNISALPTEIQLDDRMVNIINAFNIDDDDEKGGYIAHKACITTTD